MSTFDLTQKVKIVNPNASNDSQYGPYNSIGEALIATEGLRELGRTVGIIEDGVISEYWFKEGITDGDLIIKTTGNNGSGQFFKEITKDGDFTAEKITGGPDDGEYLFKIVGDETLEWTIGDENFVYNLDSNNEWTLVVDALGLGVERRIDAVSYNNAGEVQYFKGTETGQASYPNVPESHILKSFVTITAEGILIEDGGFITKLSERWTISQNTTGINWELPVLINGNNRNRRFQANIGDSTFTIGRLEVSSTIGSFYPFVPIWEGMDVSFANIGINDITIQHFNTAPPATNVYKILLPNAQDIVLKTGETITLFYDAPYQVFRLKSLGKLFSGGGSTSDDISNESTVTGANVTEALDELQNQIGGFFNLTNDDNTLYIEDDIIRLNVTGVTEEFVCDGSRNFEMTNTYTSIENVFIQGVRISEEDYTVISEQEIEIEETVTLLNGDNVAIQGTMFIIPEEE